MAGTRRALDGAAGRCGGLTGDRITTGPGGRLHIGLGDCSLLKLAENTQLHIARLDIETDSQHSENLLAGSLKIPSGSFRYTTGAPGPLKRRELQFQLGSRITAGIRGTDISGRASADAATIALLSGPMEVAVPGQKVQMMGAAHTALTSRKDETAAVTPLPASQLPALTVPMELRRDEPVLTPKGLYQVGLESFPDPDEASQALKRFSALGYPAELMRVEIQGQEWYRLVINGLASDADVRAYIPVLRQKLSLSSPWIIAPRKP